MSQTLNRPVHVGQNIQKFRLIRKKSQVELAAELEVRLRKPISQQLISDIENRVSIEDDDLLKEIADILQVDPEVLKNLDLEDALNIISNSFTTQDNASYVTNLPVYHKSTIHQTYNPLDKLVELFEKQNGELRNENQRLRDEIDKLKGNKK
jgi:transcriptional regulator with XRE-family HTH domain